MYFSLVGGSLFKAQVQNHYEKVRCNIYLKDVTRKHIHSLSNINRSIKEVQGTLRDIRASSGYCRKVQEYETTSKSNACKEQKWSTETSRTHGVSLGRSETQAKNKNGANHEIKSKNLDSGEQPTENKTSADDVRSSPLSREVHRQNILEMMEYSMQGTNGAGSGNAGCETSGDKSDIVSAGWLLRDEIVTLPDSRNVSGRVIKGNNWQGMDSTISAKNSDVKESQEKSQVKPKSSANGGKFQNVTSTKLTRKSSGSEDPPEPTIGSSELGRSRPNIGCNGLVGHQSQPAPKKASRFKPHVKAAPTSKDEFKKNSRCKYSSSSDVKAVNIHVSLSRMERKRILQELIASCSVAPDRSALERERQRRLQEKIHTFFQLLFEEDDKEDKDDGCDIHGDD